VQCVYYTLLNEVERPKSVSDSKRANYFFYFKLQKKLSWRGAKLFDEKRIQVRGAKLFLYFKLQKKIELEGAKLF
jgi:hypothetical protein